MTFFQQFPLLSSLGQNADNQADNNNATKDGAQNDGQEIFRAHSSTGRAAYGSGGGTGSAGSPRRRPCTTQTTQTRQRLKNRRRRRYLSTNGVIPPAAEIPCPNQSHVIKLVLHIRQRTHGIALRRRSSRGLVSHRTHLRHEGRLRGIVAGVPIGRDLVRDGRPYAEEDGGRDAEDLERPVEEEVVALREEVRFRGGSAVGVQ